MLEVVGHEGAAVIIVQHGALRDADAICKAVARPSMQFVPVKSAEKQAVLVLHRARELLIRQRIMLVDALRAHLAK